MVRIWLACRQWICVDGERCRCCLGGCRSRQCCCCCRTQTAVAMPRDHGGAAKRDAVASMEVSRGYGSLQVARWLTADICRSGSLMARKMVVAAAFHRRRVTEHYGSGSFRTEA